MGMRRSKKTIAKWRIWREQAKHMTPYEVALKHINPLTDLPYSANAVSNAIKKLNELEESGQIEKETTQ